MHQIVNKEIGDVRAETAYQTKYKRNYMKDTTNNERVMENSTDIPNDRGKPQKLNTQIIIYSYVRQ